MVKFQGSCLQNLIKDYISNGACFGPPNVPDLFDTTNLSCTFIPNGDDGSVAGIEIGTCSDLTESLLVLKDCEYLLKAQPSKSIINTLQSLFIYMCNTYTVVFNLDLNRANINETKVFPIDSVFQFEDATFATLVNSTNTKHRYPWICSLRSKGIRPKHYCAVTLLSRSPGPTVLVGPAHCTDLCKSSRGEVENCCCGGPILFYLFLFYHLHN